jgi:hypothetical protein
MTLRNTISLITLSVLILALSFGCARYATSDEKIVEIEKKISIGVSESEFTKNIPTAQLIDEKENKKVYVALVSETCFFAVPRKAFKEALKHMRPNLHLKMENLSLLNVLLMAVNSTLL